MAALVRDRMAGTGEPASSENGTRVRKVSLRASDTADRRVGDRAGPGGRRPPRRRRVHHRAQLRGSGRVPPRSSSPRSCELGGGEPRRRDGVLLCDKPAGITSHDVVARVRRRLGRGVKVGPCRDA